MYLKCLGEVVDSAVVVAEAEFCYTAKEISFKISGFRYYGDIEILDGFGIILF